MLAQYPMDLDENLNPGVLRSTPAQRPESCADPIPPMEGLPDAHDSDEDEVDVPDDISVPDENDNVLEAPHELGPHDLGPHDISFLTDSSDPAWLSSVYSGDVLSGDTDSVELLETVSEHRFESGNDQAVEVRSVQSDPEIAHGLEWVITVSEDSDPDSGTSESGATENTTTEESSDSSESLLSLRIAGSDDDKSELASSGTSPEISARKSRCVLCDCVLDDKNTALIFRDGKWKTVAVDACAAAQVSLPHSAREDSAKKPKRRHTVTHDEIIIEEMDLPPQMKHLQRQIAENDADSEDEGRGCGFCVIGYVVASCCSRIGSGVTACVRRVFRKRRANSVRPDSGSCVTRL